MLFTGNALAKIRDASSMGTYAVAAKGLQVASNYKCDVAFDVVDITFGRAVKIPDGMYLLPIVTVSHSDFETKRFSSRQFPPSKNKHFIAKEKNSGRILPFQISGFQIENGILIEPFKGLYHARAEPAHLYYNGKEDLKIAQEKLSKAL